METQQCWWVARPFSRFGVPVSLPDKGAPFSLFARAGYAGVWNSAFDFRLSRHHQYSTFFTVYVSYALSYTREEIHWVRAGAPAFPRFV